jgi:hypothetical protein
MKAAVLVLISFFTFCFQAKAQSIKYEDLLGGKWKHDGIPDSTVWADGTMHIVPYNPSFWFKDSEHIDVVWNGFYFPDQKYVISKKTNSIFVYIDSVYENVPGFACIFKPVSLGVMKMQYTMGKGELHWITDETWYNTTEVYKFAYRSR